MQDSNGKTGWSKTSTKPSSAVGTKTTSTGYVPEEIREMPKPQLFDDKAIAKELDPENQAEYSAIILAGYGWDGTAKTGSFMENYTNVIMPDGSVCDNVLKPCEYQDADDHTINFPDGMLSIFVDADGSAGPIKTKFHGSNKRIIIFDPMVLSEEGKVDYIGSFNKTLALTRYLMKNHKELFSTCLDGYDKILKHCIVTDAPILMDNMRHIPIGDLEVGEFVKTRKGSAEITSRTTHESNVIEITTVHQKLVLTPDHKVLARRNYGNNFYWTKAGELTPGQHIAMYLHNEDVPSTSISLDRCELLGHLIAEGSMSKHYSPGYSNTYIERFKELLDVEFPTLEMKFTHNVHYNLVQKNHGYDGTKKNPLRKWLEDLGLWGTTSHTKFVPDIVKYGSKQQLQKFMDGYIYGDGYESNVRTQTYSASKRLCDDVDFIFWRLGQVVNRHKNFVNYDYVKEGRTYAKKNYWGNIFADRIKSVEPSGKSEVVDIHVEPTNEFVVDRLIVHNCEMVMRYEDMKINPEAQIKNQWQWGNRNARMNGITLLLKKLPCETYYTTHHKFEKTFELNPATGKQELVVTGHHPDWVNSFPQELFQKIEFKRIHNEVKGYEDMEDGVVQFTATIDKAKGELRLENATVVIAEVKNAKIVRDKETGKVKVIGDWDWFGINDILNEFRRPV